MLFIIFLLLLQGFRKLYTFFVIPRQIGENPAPYLPEWRPNKGSSLPTDPGGRDLLASRRRNHLLILAVCVHQVEMVPAVAV